MPNNLVPVLASIGAQIEFTFFQINVTRALSAAGDDYRFGIIGIELDAFDYAQQRLGKPTTRILCMLISR